MSGTTVIRIITCIFVLFSWGLPYFSTQSSPTFTYYVAMNGKDTNPGSQDKPWKTIQKAAETMAAGDTVLIHAGTYYEKVIPANSGSFGNYITYQNFGDGEVIIDAQGGIRSGCIEVRNKSYLRFLGLHLRNAGYKDLNAAFAAFAGTNHLILDNIIAENSRFGIMLRGNNSASEAPADAVSFVTIKNSIVRNNASYGIFLYFKVIDSVIGPNNKIYNENTTNRVPEDDQYGINLDTDYPGNPQNGSRRIVIIGNEIFGNRIQGIRPWNAQNVLIKDNYTHHNGATGIQIEDGCANVIVDGNRSEYNSQLAEYETGIWIDSSVNVVVQNNVVRGNQIGIMVTNMNRAIIRNNLIFENNLAPSGNNVMGVVINSSSSGITFVHNTLWRNGVSGSRGNLAYCIKSPVMDAVIKNNIFSESSGDFDSWMNCSVQSDFNDFYTVRESKFNWLDTKLDWSGYLAKSGQDSHSIIGNPLFVDPAKGDFSLSEQSPNVNTGSPLTQTTSSGSGTSIQVKDARFFSDGFGLNNGDKIRVGSTITVVIQVDYKTNVILVNEPLSWNSGDNISYPFSGIAPDRGAVEMGLPTADR
jgi:parallel beta-helix repeat protein